MDRHFRKPFIVPEPSAIRPERITLPELFRAAEKGVIVLTGNRRLSLSLRRDYDRAMQEAGQQVWPTPAILPFEDWLPEQWDTAQLAGRLPSRLLLSEVQTQHLWERIVRDSDAGSGLLRPAATARLAAEADALLTDWCLELPTDEAQLNEDVRAFRDWRAAFLVACRQHDWLSRNRLIRELAEPGALRDQRDQTFYLVGFEELTPARQWLLSALEQAGAHWRWLQIAGEPGRVIRRACDDESDEIRHLARWVRTRLETNPAARIGIVVPELAARRQAICRALDQALVPEAARLDRPDLPRPYNVSLGIPLSATPLVQDALQLLALATGKQPFEATMRLLRSPHLAGWESEMGARALLDRRLREIGEPLIGLSRLRHFAADEQAAWHCPQLAPALEAMIRQVHDWPGRARPGQWARLFERLLQTAGWSQGRSLSSEEFQTREAWHKTLTELGALETVVDKLSASDALARVQALAGGRLFQPQSPQTPVQVLGLYEAIGSRFDHLWVMGMSHIAWPPSPRPNPFLPLALQRRHDLPHASEARELDVARRIIDRLCESAGEVVFSHPRTEGETELRPSPLIETFAEADDDAWPLAPFETWSRRIAEAGACETVADRAPPPVLPGSIAGGSGLLRLQAACPFRAFAEIRLGARSLGEVGIGLDPMERGNLVHRVLELFWQAVGDWHTLQDLDPDQQAEQIRLAVEQALEEEAGRLPQIVTPAFRRVEQARLSRLLERWLHEERQREPFTVEATEKKAEIDLEGLRIRLRIDRLDRLDDGRHIVVDYKTGKISPTAWFGERPDDPQLPLYSLLFGEDLAGVVFAQLKADRLGFQGLIAEADVVPGAKTPEKLKRLTGDRGWPALRKEWSDILHRLARAFRDSDTRIDPKQFPQTCRYCSLVGLCRINEAAPEIGLLTEEGNDG